MKQFYIGLFFCLLVFPAYAQQQNLTFDFCRKDHPEYKSCDSDADCVMIINPCGNLLDAASNAFKKEAIRCNHLKGAAMNCAPPTTSIAPHKAICKNNLCTAQEVK